MYNTTVPAIVDYIQIYMSFVFNMGYVFEQKVNFWMCLRTLTTEFIQSNLVTTLNDPSGAPFINDLLNTFEKKYNRNIVYPLLL